MKTIVFITLIMSVILDAMYQGKRNWLAEKNDNDKIKKKYLYWWKKDKVMFLIAYAFFIVSAYILESEIYDRYTETYYYFYSYINAWTGIRSENVSIMLEIILMYAVMRLLLFDYVHNIFMKNHIMYVGRTGTMDKMYRKIAKYFNPLFLFMFRMFIFAIVTYFHYSVIL